MATLIFSSYTGQQRFCPMRKNVRFWCIFDTEFKYVSRISLSPTPFSLHRNMWKHKPTYVSHRGPIGCSLTCCNKQSHVIHVWLTILCWLLARTQCVIISEVHSICSTINMPRKCINSSDVFHYICGEVTFKSWRLSFTPLIKKCYEHYFSWKVGDQDKSWAPQFLLCDMCQASHDMGKRFTL